MSRISSSGVSLNAVPSACQAYLDRRMVLGETEQAIQDEMDRLVAGKNASWEIGTLHWMTWKGEPLTYQPFHMAWEISLQHELAQAAIAAYTETLGTKPETYEFCDFSTNAVALVGAGIPTIGFGPGDHKLAHMRDEKCSVDQILAACEVYTRMINRLFNLETPDGEAEKHEGVEEQEGILPPSPANARKPGAAHLRKE